MNNIENIKKYKHTNIQADRQKINKDRNQYRNDENKEEQNERKQYIKKAINI